MISIRLLKALRRHVCTAAAAGFAAAALLASTGLLRAQEPVALAGARLHVKLETALSTASAKLREPVHAELIEDLKARGLTVLPAGAQLSGSVVKVRHANPRAMPIPMLRIKFTRATLPGGQSFPLEASVEVWATDVYAGGAGASPQAGGFGAQARAAARGHHEPWDNFTLASGDGGWLHLDADFAGAGGTAPESAAAPASTAGAKSAANAPINVRLYIGSDVDTGQPLDMEALRGAVRQAGIPVVTFTSTASLLLGVWRDDSGLHGALTDTRGASLWTGTVANDQRLAQELCKYLRAHPHVGIPANNPVNPPPVMMAGFQAGEGRPAPDFSLKAANGQTYSLQSVKGKVVLVDFWASWCPYCRRSMPSVVDLSRKFAGSAFMILGVSIDADAHSWRRYVRDHELSWPQYLDRDRRISHLFGVRGVPAFILIDQKGAIFYQQRGWGEGLEPRLESMIEQELKTPGQPVKPAVYGGAPTPQSPLPQGRPTGEGVSSVSSSSPMPMLPGLPGQPASRASSSAPKAVLKAELPPGVTAPRLLDDPEPPYPKAARENQIQGMVHLQIVINAQGQVTDVKEVGKRLGYGLDGGAIATLRTWRFKPATRDGLPVAVRVLVEISFRLRFGP